MARAVVRAVATKAGARVAGAKVQGGAGDGSGAHQSTSINANRKPRSLLASAFRPRLFCSEAIAAGEKRSVYHAANTSGTMRTFDIEAREYREVRVLGPRGPRAGRLWQACEMRASLLGDASFCVSSSPGRLGEFSFLSLWKMGPLLDCLSSTDLRRTPLTTTGRNRERGGVEPAITTR